MSGLASSRQQLTSGLGTVDSSALLMSSVMIAQGPPVFADGRFVRRSTDATWADSLSFFEGDGLSVSHGTALRKCDILCPLRARFTTPCGISTSGTVRREEVLSVSLHLWTCSPTKVLLHNQSLNLAYDQTARLQRPFGLATKNSWLARPR